MVDVPVEVVLQHTGERTPRFPVGDRAKRPRGIGVDAVVHLKEDAQDGYDEREGEDVEDGGEDVEGDVQRHEAFIGRNEPSQDAEEVFHILSIRGMNLAWGWTSFSSLDGRKEANEDQASTEGGDFGRVPEWVRVTITRAARCEAPAGPRRWIMRS